MKERLYRRFASIGRAALSIRGILAALVTGWALAGCGSEGGGDVEDWMTQQRARTSARVESVEPPRSFAPEPYTQASAPDPFSPQRLAPAMAPEGGAAAAGAALVAAEARRRRQPLEDHPLEAMMLVGMLARPGHRVALIRVNGQVFQAGVGQYLGPHYGKILRITDSEVLLREIVRDSQGLWVERVVTLQASGKSP
jgi:type IV pilus assembly protein PilP